MQGWSSWGSEARWRRSPRCASSKTPRHSLDELNLLDRHVFFHDWVPYEDRQNWLLQADVGLSLHLNSLESRFAYRTRMLDNIWCGLPVVATNGDVLADLVERERVGIVVEPNDPDAVADALIVALDPERQRMFRANLGGLVERNTWENVAAPLLRWCRNPAKVSEPGTDPRDRYTHHLELTYSETAEYARRLERVIEEKDRTIQSLQITPRNLASLALKRVMRVIRRGG